jgi:hypothetical protein
MALLRTKALVPVKPKSGQILPGLAISRGGVLATLDKGIAALTEPKSAERKALETLE